MQKAALLGGIGGVSQGEAGRPMGFTQSTPNSSSLFTKREGVGALVVR